MRPAAKASRTFIAPLPRGGACATAALLIFLGVLTAHAQQHPQDQRQLQLRIQELKMQQARQQLMQEQRLQQQQLQPYQAPLQHEESKLQQSQMQQAYDQRLESLRLQERQRIQIENGAAGRQPALLPAHGFSRSGAHFPK